MPNQPVRRVVRGTLTQWNRLFGGAGRHSDLVTVRRRSQGDAGGREEKLSAIGSQISSLFRLVWCSLLCGHSYISLPASAIAALFPPPAASSFNFQSGPPCPQGNPLPKVKSKTVQLKWDWFRQAGAEQDPSNKTSSSCRIKACNQQLVKQHKCSSSCRCWWACYCVACNGHGPMKGLISFSLYNAAVDRAVLWASCKTQICKWLVCFKKLCFWRQSGQASPNLFKHSKLLAPVVWGINVNTLQDQEFTLNS